MEDRSSKRGITVIGAGIVGIGSALYLQREGYSVTIIDYQGPGEGASSGNAGLIAQGSCLPLGLPGILTRVPGMLLDPLGPLTIRPTYLPRMAPWLLRFLAASTPRRVEQISRALHNLYKTAVEDLQILVKQAGASDLIKAKGKLDIYQTKQSLAQTALKQAILRRRGVNFQVLDGPAIRELEPGLGGELAGGFFFPDHVHTLDPLQLTVKLAEHFQGQGGKILREKVTGFDMAPEGPRKIFTEENEHPVEILLLAAGAYSRKLAALLGSKVPLEAERGYNMVLPKSGVKLLRPIISGDHSFCMTPMADGLRLAGTAEFAGIAAPPNYSRSRRLFDAAQRIFGNLNDQGATKWMGSRPSLPDSLPVISQSPSHPAVFFAFGHGHLGLTGAGVTGRLITDLIAGRKTGFDFAPYRVDRF